MHTIEKTEPVIAHATDATFHQEVEKSHLPVVVDFWAPWCAPCRMLGSTLEKVAPEFAGTLRIVKINVDENPETASRFGIRSIPTLVFFRAGKPLGMIPGALPAEPLREVFRKHADGRLSSS